MAVCMCVRIMLDVAVAPHRRRRRGPCRNCVAALNFIYEMIVVNCAQGLHRVPTTRAVFAYICGGVCTLKAMWLVHKATTVHILCDELQLPVPPFTIILYQRYTLVLLLSS